MKKAERMDRYTYTMGLNSWEVAPYRGKDLPKIVMNDGPCGVRKPLIQDFDNQGDILVSVCMPNPSALAASFDQEAVYENGRLLAEDCLSKNVHILLAPGVNIKRNALCGRNFEYFSEDPYLSGILGSQYVRGLEENGAGACVKHYCCNNQEFRRKGVSSQVSLRALNEIYLRPFSLVCRYGNPTALMTSYNQVNDEYPGESYYLLQKKLRQEFAFKGMVMSDWCGVYDKAAAIRNGMNLEMPISLRTPEYDESLYRKGGFSEQDLLRRDKEYFRAVKKFYAPRPKADYDMDAIHEKAVGIAEETMILIKNKRDYLPFKASEKILVIGYLASHSRFVGGGSGWVNAYKKESVLDVFDRFKVAYDFIEGYDRSHLLLNEEDLKDKVGKYDKVLLFLGQFDEDESEGWDRKGIDLSLPQKETVKLVRKVLGKFAAVVITGSVVNLKEVYASSQAAMISYLAGEGQSEAIYRNLYGLHNPCGRLPETWISSLHQHPLYRAYLKYDPYYTFYREDIFVGYRYYDLHARGFLLPFGYGLSYSSFAYADFRVVRKRKEVICSLKVKNVSEVAGSDVVQVYASLPDSNIYRPVKELKGFAKVHLLPNEEKTVKIVIPLDDLASYCEEADAMIVERGNYRFLFAKNAREILHVSSPVSVPGKTFDVHRTPKRIPDKRAEKKFRYDTPVPCAFASPVFEKSLREFGCTDEDIALLHERHWLVLSDINYAIHKLDFVELDEVIARLNEGEERKAIPEFRARP